MSESSNADASSEPSTLTKENGESKTRVKARAVIRPTLSNAATIREAVKGYFGQTELFDLVDELGQQCAAVFVGSLGVPRQY